MNSTTFLATHALGRVVLHLVCLLKRPTHAAWHWQGILREWRGNPALIRIREKASVKQ